MHAWTRTELHVYIYELPAAEPFIKNVALGSLPPHRHLTSPRCRSILNHFEPKSQNAILFWEKQKYAARSSNIKQITAQTKKLNLGDGGLNKARPGAALVSTWGSVGWLLSSQLPPNILPLLKYFALI